MIRYYIFSGLNNEQSTDVDTRIQNVVHVNHRMRDAEKRKEKSRFPQIIYYLFFSCFVFLPLFAATKKKRTSYRLRAGNATKCIICHAMTMAITATTITLVVRLSVFPSTETFGSFNFCVEHLDVRRAFSEFLRFMVCRLARRTQRKALSLINQYNFVCSTSRIDSLPLFFPFFARISLYFHTNKICFELCLAKRLSGAQWLRFVTAWRTSRIPSISDDSYNRINKHNTRSCISKSRCLFHFGPLGDVLSRIENTLFHFLIFSARLAFAL